MNNPLLSLSIYTLFYFNCFTLLAADALAKSGPDFQHYVTEPNITAVKLNILQNHDPKALAPGHIFIAPYRGYEGWGPQIFDVEGNLIWFGGSEVKDRAIDLQPCLFKSDSYDHLCFNDALPVEQSGHSSGVIKVYDNTYTKAASDFEGTGGLRGPDIHELNTPVSRQGKTVIQDIYQVRSIDLKVYGGPEDGYVLDGCFQEIDVSSREIVFQWCSLEHVDIDTTYVYLQGSKNYTIPGLAGTGNRNTPWDWFHINAIDRNEAGDYLISSRHTNTIFHVAGPKNKQGHKPGEVIWHLGGKLNDFTMDKGFNFSAQHTIRYHKVESHDHMVVSFFNNAWEGRTKTAKTSSGMLVDLDAKSMHASLTTRFLQPAGLMSQDQGNLQMLPNGNGFLGWGHCNYFSEHSTSGKTLYYAQFGGHGDCDRAADTFYVSSFRAWKYPWKGFPKWTPKLVAYAQSCQGPAHVYVSWNGATEVDKWAFYASNHSRNYKSAGNFKRVTTVSKAGFETNVKVNIAKYFYAQPLDSQGNLLRMSPVIKTFVPNPKMKCGKKKCKDLSKQDASNSIAEQCFISLPVEGGDLPRLMFGELALGPVGFFVQFLSSWISRHFSLFNFF